MHTALLGSQGVRIDFDYNEVVVFPTPDTAKISGVGLLPRRSHSAVTVGAVVYERHVGVHIQACCLNEGREGFKILIP